MFSQVYPTIQLGGNLRAQDLTPLELSRKL